MLRVVSAEGRTPLTPPPSSPGHTRPAAPEFPARNHGMMEPLRLEKPSRIVQPNQHGRVTPNWCPQGATSKRSLEEPELGTTHPQRVWQLRFGMWDCPDNGVSPTMGFLPRARHLPSQPFSPWALSQCRIYPERARAAFSPGGQSHSRPVQDFRTDLSTSPGPRYPRRSCWLCSQALGSAGSELSLTEDLATAASRCGSRCGRISRSQHKPRQDNGNNHSNRVRNLGRDSGGVLGGRKYPVLRLEAAFSPPQTSWGHSPLQEMWSRAGGESLDNREGSVGNPPAGPALTPKGCWIWGLSAATKWKSRSQLRSFTPRPCSHRIRSHSWSERSISSPAATEAEPSTPHNSQEKPREET